MAIPLNIDILFLKEELFMQNEPAQTDRPASRLETHANDLSSILNSLERASMQYANILNRLRGTQPEAASGSDKAALQPVEPPVIQRLERTANDVHNLANILNNQADELQEYL